MVVRSPNFFKVSVNNTCDISIVMLMAMMEMMTNLLSVTLVSLVMSPHFKFN